MTQNHTDLHKRKSDLKARFFTAALLIPFIFFALFILPQLSYGIVTAFIVLVAACEWPTLIGKGSVFNSMMFICGQVFVLGFGFFLIQITGHTGWVSFAAFVFCILMWLCLFYFVVYFERYGKLPIYNNVFNVLVGLLILLFFWLGLNIVRDVDHGRFFVLYLLILIWGADIIAYFAGKKWGNTKLTPKVSPNKTWVGVWSALVFSIVLGCIAALVFPLTLMQRLSLIPLSFIVILFGILGDLTISAFKRQQNLKDTGTLLPGHGGLLDRIDSLVIGAPTLALGLMIIGL